VLPPCALYVLRHLSATNDVSRLASDAIKGDKKGLWQCKQLSAALHLFTTGDVLGVPLECPDINIISRGHASRNRTYKACKT
jgi:hypothetical protein